MPEYLDELISATETICRSQIQYNECYILSISEPFRHEAAVEMTVTQLRCSTIARLAAR